MTENKDIWIKAGYEVFATSGHEALKVEPLARMAGKSKSSFYHHFADMELFIEHLLAYHLGRSEIIAEKERSAKVIDPDMIHVLVDHRLDLLFNRQLRINQNVKSFSDTLVRSDRIVGDAFKRAWIKDLDVALTPQQMDAVFKLALENFFLQINTDNIHYAWLSAYFSNLKKLAGSMQ